MKEQEHKDRHKLLHEMLDEIIAGWITSAKRKRLSEATILELIDWSAQQAHKPDHTHKE